MRVTAETKSRTRERILKAAARLFVRRGYEQTTTRDLASAAGVAAGTLFNYFPSKEDVAMSLVADGVAAARRDYAERLRGDESAEEALFLLVVTELRRLVPYRGFVGAAVETALSPFAEAGEGSDAALMRTEHLELVAEILRRRCPATEPSAVQMHLYWTLYLGVLAFWSRDDSPNQEETLVLLDQSIRMFVAAASPGAIP